MSNTTFEPATLPLAEKERLVRDLLEEFGLPVKAHYVNREELVIPCVLGSHADQERNPTGAINYQKLTFKCLGCQRSGGLLWFIAEHRGGTTTEARKWLGAETGTDGQVQDLQALLRYFDALYAGKEAKAPIPRYSPQMLDPWRLIHPWMVDEPMYDNQGRNVGGRGFPEANVLRFEVGYAEEYFMGKDLPTSERIVFPHYWKGNLVGWQSRALANDGTAKYKATPDFPRDETIYNYNPERYSTAVVVESPASVVRHDIEDPTRDLHMVATFGANITERQIKLLGRYKRLVWWLDNDTAGWTAYQGLFDHRGRQTKMGVLEASAQMTDVWAVDSHWHADPADLGLREVKYQVKHSIPWVLWGVPPGLVCFRCCEPAHAGGCQ